MEDRFFTENELFDIFFEDWSKEYRTFQSYLKKVVSILKTLCNTTYITQQIKEYIIGSLGFVVDNNGDELNKINCEGALLLKVLVQSYANKTLKLMEEGKTNIEQGRDWMENEVYKILYDIEEKWDEVSGNTDDIDMMVGMKVKVVIENVEKDGIEYSNIISMKKAKESRLAINNNRKLPLRKSSTEQDATELDDWYSIEDDSKIEE